MNHSAKPIPSLDARALQISGKSWSRKLQFGSNGADILE